MMQPPHYEVCTILVADMVGYSTWLTEQPAATHTAFTHHLRHVFDPCVCEHSGRIVKTTGDGFVGIFKSSAAAESCAQKIHDNLIDLDSSDMITDPPLEYRIGVHSGEIIIEQQDVFGLAVNIAIHMQSLANPGGICISHIVYNELPENRKTEYKYIGEKYLKNIMDPVPLFCSLSSNVHAIPSRCIRLRRDRRRNFLTPPPRLGLAELDTRIDDRGEYISQLVMNSLFHSTSHHHDLFSAIPLGEVVTTKTIRNSNIRKSIHQQLHLDYVIFGSVLENNNKWVTTIYLLNVRSDEILWVGRIVIGNENLGVIDQVISDDIILPAVFHLQRHEIDSQDRSWRSVDENRFHEARRLLMRGTLESTGRARQLLSEILDRCGDVGDVHLSLARAEHMHGRLLAGQEFGDALERARAHAIIAIEIDDLNAQAHSELALQEIFLGRQAAAEKMYQRAMRLNPYDQMLQADWAECLTVMGRAKEAMPILERAAAGWPRDRSWVEWNLCDTLWALDRPDRIVEILDHRSELPHVHRLLAAANAKLGRGTQAKEHAERVLGYQPSFSTKEWSKIVPFAESETGDQYVEFLERAGL